MTKRWFFMMLVPFLVLALNRVGSEELLGYHHFRQAHTALTARNFAFHDANILHPTIDGVTYGKDLYLNEFPLYPYMVGLLWRVFGEHLVLARLLSILFAVMAMWYYGKLLNVLVPDRLVTAGAVFVMSVTPVMAYFAKCVGRQTLFLFLLLAGMFHLVRYFRAARTRDALVGGVALSGALLLNPYAVYIGIPLGVLAFDSLRMNAFRRWPLWLAALTALLPAAAWYGSCLAASRHLNTESMIAINDPNAQRNLLDLSHYAMLLKATNWERVFRTFSRYVLPPVSSVLLFIFGLRAARDPAYRFFKVWLACVLLYFLLDFYPIAVTVHHYYYLNVVPLTALFFALAVVTLTRRLWRPMNARLDRSGDELSLRATRPQARAMLATATLALCVLLFACESFARARHMEADAWHAQYYQLVEPLRKAVPDGARLTVVAESNDPLFSYLFAPVVAHRLVLYKPADLDAVLAAGDFDYLLVLCDRTSFPLDDVLDAVDATGYLGRPVLRRAGAVLYRKAQANGINE